MTTNKEALDALDRLYSQPNGYNENKAADDHNLIYDALQTQAELVEALKSCGVNEHGQEYYDASKVAKALARAEGRVVSAPVEDFNCPHCGFEYPSEWLEEHSLPDTCDGCGEKLEEEVNNGAEEKE